MGSLLLSPGSWCVQGFVCALQESVSPVLCKFWWPYGGVNGDLLQEGLCHTQVCCIQSPCPCSRPLLTRTSAGDTQTQFWLSLCGVSGSWILLKQSLFEPPEHLWRVWGLVGMGRNINNLSYEDGTTLMAESEELKSLLMKLKEESGKVGLKLNIQKTKIMASGPITSWQINEEMMETVTDFIFLHSKITADGDCSHEIKRLLLLGRKVMTNLDSIFKSRDITLPTKVRLVKAMVFPVVMYGCESWTVKKAEP